MAFESLGEKLQDAFDKLKGRGTLSEKDVKDTMRIVKLALLEADVNIKVVKDFIKNVTEKASTEDVLKSLTPGQQVIKLVNEELTALMGTTNEKLVFSSQPPSFILLAGLQGAGKTTACAKLAKFLQKKGKRPLMVACDVYRPAAIEQLKILGEKINVPVFFLDGEKNPVTIVKKAKDHAVYYDNDVVLVDTAGRLHIDEQLMQELVDIKNTVEPKEILLVLDAMTGQDAVNVAESFHGTLDVTGILMSKLDGDTRGGAALSVRAVTGKPIKFASTGEKLEDLEEFHPERMASRILGMGDMLSLIERAQEQYDEKKAETLAKKMKTATFDFEDFLEQLEQLQKMGPLGDILSMVPGMNKKMKNINVDDKQLVKTKAIIQSMTAEERRHPEILAASRKKRIAAGCGMHVSDVNRLLKQFTETRKLMKRFGGKNMKQLKRGGFPF